MKYLLVYSDAIPNSKLHNRKICDIIHIDKINHQNLMGRTYFDVFVTIDCFPTEEQLIELRCCLKRI